MKIFSALTFALVTISVHGEGDDHDHGDHEDGHKCACEAIEFNFLIDCSDTDTMTNALGRLQSGGCASDCTGGTCERDWLIVQTHHDHCPEAGIPSAIETGFHDYDEVCASCDIVRQAIPGAPQCPIVNCTDGSGTAAYQNLLTNNCNIDCNESCKEDWLTLRVVHDTCDHSALTQAAEEGLHAIEEPCAAHQCNLPLDIIDNTLECTEDIATDGGDSHDHDHGDAHSPTPTTADSGSFKLGGLLATGSIIAMTVAIGATF